MSYRFAIVGCGQIASRHAEQIRAVAELAAVCDTDERKAVDLAARYNAHAYFSIETMLQAEQLDVVVVCTPNGLHRSHCIQALEAGLNVLCEKPLSISVQTAREMIKAAERKQKRLYVVKQNRFNKPVVAVKKLLDNGKLGDISGFQINCFWNRPDRYYESPWRGTNTLDGGILFTQFSHFIDLLYWFLGEISAAGGWRGNYQHKKSIEFEDTGSASLVMKSGVTGTVLYTINAHSSNMEGSFTLFGAKGTVKIGGQYLNRIDYFSVENEQPPPDDSSMPNRYDFYQGSMSHHDMVYTELMRALDDPAYPFVQASEALKSIEMIEQIYAASPFIQIAPAT